MYQYYTMVFHNKVHHGLFNLYLTLGPVHNGLVESNDESRNPSWTQEPIVNPGTYRESRNLSWIQEPIVNPGTHREYPQEGRRLDAKRH